MPSMTIGRLSRASEVSIDTIRYYEREKLLPAAARTAAGYRVYDQDSLRRLRFIRRAKQLGFNLDDIRNLLALTDGDGPSAEVKQLTEQKLRLVEDRIKDLRRMQKALQVLSDSCDGCGPTHQCPIIDALNEDDHA